MRPLDVESVTVDLCITLVEHVLQVSHRVLRFTQLTFGLDQSSAVVLTSSDRCLAFRLFGLEVLSHTHAQILSLGLVVDDLPLELVQSLVFQMLGSVLGCLHLAAPLLLALDVLVAQALVVGLQLVLS